MTKPRIFYQVLSYDLKYIFISKMDWARKDWNYFTFIALRPWGLRREENTLSEKLRLLVMKKLSLSDKQMRIQARTVVSPWRIRPKVIDDDYKGILPISNCFIRMEVKSRHLLDRKSSQPFRELYAG